MSGESMVGFGPKQAWLAVRNGEPAAVRAALRLRDLGPVAWRAGVDLAYLTDDRVVLTPPLDGAGGSRWLLVTGKWLWTGPSSVTELSAALDTEVHRYFSHRGPERHEWDRAAQGTLIRSFAYVGSSAEILRSIGDPDPAEPVASLGDKPTVSALGLEQGPDRDEDVLIGESDVMRLAGLWSVDPTGLDGQPATGPLRAAAPD